MPDAHGYYDVDEMAAFITDPCPKCGGPTRPNWAPVPPTSGRPNGGWMLASTRCLTLERDHTH